MSRFMNDYDREVAISTFTRETCPNLLGLALMVDHLAEWADSHSDGWAYWAKPRNAADKAMAEIEAGLARHRSWLTKVNEVDCSDETMAACARPVKAFLTRQKARPEDREYILRSVTN